MDVATIVRILLIGFVVLIALNMAGMLRRRKDVTHVAPPTSEPSSTQEQVVSATNELDIANQFQQLVQTGDIAVVIEFVERNEAVLEKVLGKPAIAELRRGLAVQSQWKCEYCGRTNQLDERQCPGCAGTPPLPK